MKLANFAILMTGAGFAQVIAVPLLVIPNDTDNTPSFRIRLGHAVPMRDDIPQSWPMGGKKVPCHSRSSRFHQKAVEISNILRQALGLPPIQTSDHPSHGHDEGKFRILPFIGTPITHLPVSHDGEIEGGVHDISNLPHPHPPHPHPPHPHHGHHPHHHHHHHHRHGKGSFVARIQYSLTNLGRWEGRAVAFVLGCGIGVLLRMFWVLTLVMYRAVKGQRDDEHEYSQITIIEEVVDSPKSSPPSYTYLVDEKVAIATDVVQVPSTPEESK